MHHGGDNHPQCIMAETIAHNASRLVYHCNRSPSERIHQVSFAVALHSTRYNLSFSSTEGGVDVTQGEGYVFQSFLQTSSRTGQDRTGSDVTKQM